MSCFVLAAPDFLSSRLFPRWECLRSGTWGDRRQRRAHDCLVRGQEFIHCLLMDLHDRVAGNAGNGAEAGVVWLIIDLTEPTAQRGTRPLRTPKIRVMNRVLTVG